MTNAVDRALVMTPAPVSCALDGTRLPSFRGSVAVASQVKSVSGAHGVAAYAGGARQLAEQPVQAQAWLLADGPARVGLAGVFGGGERERQIQISNDGDTSTSNTTGTKPMSPADYRTSGPPG